MKLTALYMIIAVFIGASGNLIAADDPKWSELVKLFGSNTSSEEVKTFVNTYALSKADKGGSGSFSSPQQSYSVMFDRDIVSTIILKTSHWRPAGYTEEDWRPYRGDLPAQIKREHVRSDIIEMFGKSHTVAGDTWVVEGLKIWIFFNEKTGIIDELYISK